jgi:hypothetical protein
MRRVARFKLNANYTLQFVEGTGSDDQSQSNLVSSNQPNFRTIYPVSTDNRHQIKLALDYRFERGANYKGPMVGNHQILADFGVNLAFNLRSGSPQRQGATVTDEATSDIGTGSGAGRSRTVSLNARLPWYSRLDLRINKDYEFNLGKKKEGKEPRTMGISIYVYIQNLLNTQNVLTQYAYTLSASDDGYLAAPSSAISINAKTSPQAYKDQYRAKVNNPDNYSLPRRIYIGANINF